MGCEACADLEAAAANAAGHPEPCNYTLKATFAESMAHFTTRTPSTCGGVTLGWIGVQWAPRPQSSRAIRRFDEALSALERQQADREGTFRMSPFVRRARAGLLPAKVVQS